MYNVLQCTMHYNVQCFTIYNELQYTKYYNVQCIIMYNVLQCTMYYNVSQSFWIPILGPLGPEIQK